MAEASGQENLAEVREDHYTAHYYSKPLQLSLCHLVLLSAFNTGRYLASIVGKLKV